ncbi:MAG TPA: phosphate:sodium symporter, partial [Cryomorphaceae bacterium]|nr:phosphate:sodium symporter [Cryomorphaceae bacterium]
MDSYLLLVVLLFSLSALGLIVGVSNDAVNFLNSSIGSKVASMRTILIVASLGVLLGTTFSSGMMEVARKSVFNPGYFSFHALMFIFVAVMLTNVILLDIYNTLGFPTSTTVSLVFTLFGAGASIGFLTAIQNGLDPFAFADYINVNTTVDIVQGIFSSVGIALVAGISIQWLARLAFTYKLEDSLKKLGGIFSGIAATLIINFLIFKGLKGSSFLTKEAVTGLLAYQNYILGSLFIVFTVIGQVMISVIK